MAVEENRGTQHNNRSIISTVRDCTMEELRNWNGRPVVSLRTRDGFVAQLPLEAPEDAVATSQNYDGTFDVEIRLIPTKGRSSGQRFSESSR